MRYTIGARIFCAIAALIREVVAPLGRAVVMHAVYDVAIDNDGDTVRPSWPSERSHPRTHPTSDRHDVEATEGLTT